MAEGKTPNQERVENLGTSEWNLIIHLARGLKIEEIAEEMGVSASAVRAWAHRLRLKLDVGKTSQIPYAYYLATGNNPYEMVIREK